MRPYQQAKGDLSAFRGSCPYADDTPLGQTYLGLNLNRHSFVVQTWASNKPHQPSMYSREMGLNTPVRPSHRKDEGTSEITNEKHLE